MTYNGISYDITSPLIGVFNVYNLTAAIIEVNYLCMDMNEIIRRVNSLKQPVKTQQTTASNIDSMKFLQSMTQIYEKNGRPDLAKGLKAGMLKAKANV